VARLGETQEFELGEALVHFGVKGMKWGVRKERAGTLEGFGPGETSRTLPNGDVLTVTKQAPGMTARTKAFFSAASAEKTQHSADLVISANGVAVGNGRFIRKSQDELYLAWLGVNEESRGRGYGQAVFASAINHGQAMGVKKLTLRVDSETADARHIYEKMGFTVTGNPGASMLKMEYRLDK